MPQYADAVVYAPFLDFFSEWEGRHGIPFAVWRGAFVPDAGWLQSFRERAGGRKVGVALLRGLLPEMTKVLEEARMPLGDASNLVYVSTGEDVLMAPEGISVMHFDNYTLGRRAARLLLNIVDRGKDGSRPENLVIPAAQKG
jgi:hypothetical protein